MLIAQCAHDLFLSTGFSFSGCSSSQQLSQNTILLTTIKFKDFKALNLVQSNSRLSRPHTDPDCVPPHTPPYIPLCADVTALFSHWDWGLPPAGDICLQLSEWGEQDGDLEAGDVFSMGTGSLGGTCSF